MIKVPEFVQGMLPPVRCDQQISKGSISALPLAVQKPHRSCHVLQELLSSLVYDLKQSEQVCGRPAFYLIGPRHLSLSWLFLSKPRKILMSYEWKAAFYSYYKQSEIIDSEVTPLTDIH